MVLFMLLAANGTHAQVLQTTTHQTNQSQTTSEDYQVVRIDTLTTIDGVSIIEELLRDTVPAPQTVQPVAVPALPAADTLTTDTLTTGLPTVSAAEVFQTRLATFRSWYDDRLQRWDDIYLPAPAGVRSNPDYYKLSMPATYYPAAIEQAVSIEQWEPTIPFLKQDTLRQLVFQVPDLEHSKAIDRAINRQLLSFYVEYPQLVKKNELHMRGLEPLADRYVVKEQRTEKMMTFAHVSATPSGLEGDKDLLVMKPNFWTVGGKAELRFSQNHISDNWYKGGESTKSLFAQLEWQFNYDNKQNVQFENKIEWRLGFITTPSDTVHHYKANNDLLRISSKLGIKAFQNWYYTLSGEFKTQLFPSYATNSDDLISTFFSPAELNLGIGMDFKYVKNAVCNLSVLMNPLNYTRYSVASSQVDPTKFNIEAGKKVKNQIGSRIESTLKWKIQQNLMWESRFSYNTDYKKVLSEWENTFTFSFNKYFSTNLFVHTRFDDSVNRAPDTSYFQLQEQLSLGLTYKW